MKKDDTNETPKETKGVPVKEDSSYDEDSIKVLGGLRSRKKKARHVHRLDREPPGSTTSFTRSSTTRLTRRSRVSVKT